MGVKIENLKKFWPAESYHQNYADRNPIKYNSYRWGSGRDKRLNELWGNLARVGNPWLTQGRSINRLKF
jgi:peptide-methionine (S)-S-oxide reductase